jgi:hypothetical protein
VHPLAFQLFDDGPHRHVDDAVPTPLAILVVARARPALFPDLPLGDASERCQVRRGADVDAPAGSA